MSNLPESNGEWSVARIPYFENLDRHAPVNFPERFTEEESRYLRPFFTNLQEPVYCMVNLPDEVKGALASRYSRSVGGLRRVFLREYVGPIVKPEKQKNWDTLSLEAQKSKVDLKKKFFELIDFYEQHGGLKDLVNTQRAENFYAKWLADYSDDSIEELGNVMVCFEGMSNVVFERVINKRVGISPIAKSSRYVPYGDRKENGEFLYYVDGEIRGTKNEKRYRSRMDKLFKTYNEHEDPYFNYICERYPKEEFESDDSFTKSRSAKRYDDLRDLLPFAAEINFAINGNGRGVEDLLTNLLSDSNPEARWWGQRAVYELDNVVPSFVKRPQTERGAKVQLYKRNLVQLADYMMDDIFGDIEISETRPKDSWIKLLASTPQADVEVLSAFLFPSHRRLTLETIRERVSAMEPDERANKLAEILAERKFGKFEPVRATDRFRKVPRAFESAHYLMEMWARGGDYRDLHRHREKSEKRQPFTTKWGDDYEMEVRESPYFSNIQRAVRSAGRLHNQFRDEVGEDSAEYPIPFAYVQHWMEDVSARQIYWEGELRTGPQGRRHYKEIILQKVDAVSEVDPAIFQGVMVDREDYPISRRESEIKIANKLQELGA